MPGPGKNGRNLWCRRRRWDKNCRHSCLKTVVRSRVATVRRKRRRSFRRAATGQPKNLCGHEWQWGERGDHGAPGTDERPTAEPQDKVGAIAEQTKRCPPPKLCSPAGGDGSAG